MNRLYSMSLTNLPPGMPGAPAPDKLLEGNPEFLSQPLENPHIEVGIWSATPGHHRVERGGDFTECFYLLEGEVELREDETGLSRTYGPGEMVIIAPHFKGSWKTLSPLRKVYFGHRS